MLKYTRQSDPEIYELVVEELHRQEKNIEMIASESTVPLEVMELSGSVFTNKTLEGLPGKRFQAGSEVADKLEELGWKRAKELFGAEHVNLQSYSGSTANYSVFASVLEPGDKILAMRLDQGGHLTHGSSANWVSKIYHHDFYGVNPETEQIDYDALEAKAKEFRPKMIIAGASAYPRLIDYERMAKIAEIMKYFRDNPLSQVGGIDVAKRIDFQNDTVYDCKDNVYALPPSNVIQYQLADGSKVTMRPSGTEPKIKIYFSTKGKSMAEAQAIAEKCQETILPMIDKLIGE